MASGPNTSWQTDGETMETVTDFIFLDSKFTADGDFSHEIKTGLVLGRKAMNNRDSILKSRDITLPTKVHLVKAMVFLVVTYGCESWTKRKFSAEELMLLNCGDGEDSWETLGNSKEIQPVHPKGNQSWIFIGRTRWSWSSDTLATWCEELTHWKRPWCWERLKLGEGDGCQMR